jgi:hypothetical protein
MRELELHKGIRIHLIHVAGTRMIEQGTDGISRGNLMEGVMTGMNMLEFVPISLSTISRSKTLLNWIRNWTKLPGLEPLTEKDWMWKGQGLSDNIGKNCNGIPMVFWV